MPILSLGAHSWIKSVRGSGESQRESITNRLGLEDARASSEGEASGDVMRHDDAMWGGVWFWCLNEAAGARHDDISGG